MLPGRANLASCRHAGNRSRKSKDKPIRFPRLRNQFLSSPPNSEYAESGPSNRHKLGKFLFEISMRTNERRARRSSRNRDPHNFQHLRSATVRTCTALVWHPGPAATLVLCGRLQIASLIRRTVRQSLHSLLCRCRTLVPACPRSALTKTPKPESIRGLRLQALGCIRKRRTLFNLLHEYWSRSPSLLPVPMFLLLHNSRHPCSSTDTLSSERAGRPYVNRSVSQSIGDILYELYQHPTNQNYPHRPARSAFLVPPHQGIISFSFCL